LEKIQEKARIICREQVAAQIFHLRLESPLISGRAQPGQFVMLKVRDGTDPSCRRPCLLLTVPSREGKSKSSQVTEADPGSVAACPRDHVSIIGPLGNGFELLSTRPCRSPSLRAAS